MENLRKQIYKGYAFCTDGSEMSKINNEIKNELREKWNIVMNPSKDLIWDDYDLVIDKRGCFHHSEYTLLKNDTDMSDDELALICDSYNLCYGYTRKSDFFFYVFED